MCAAPRLHCPAGQKKEEHQADDHLLLPGQVKHGWLILKRTVMTLTQTSGDGNIDQSPGHKDDFFDALACQERLHLLSRQRRRLDFLLRR